MFFDTVAQAFSDLKDIQADEKNPNDCAKTPHEITHTVDGIRYFCVSRVLAAEAIADRMMQDEEDEDTLTDYESYMTGGEITAGYLLG